MPCLTNLDFHSPQSASCCYLTPCFIIALSTALISPGEGERKRYSGEKEIRKIEGHSQLGKTPGQGVKGWPVHSLQTKSSDMLGIYLQLHLWICFTSMKRSLFALNMNPVAGQKKEARESFLLFPILEKKLFLLM